MSLETYTLFALPGMFLTAALIALGILRLQLWRHRRARENCAAVTQAIRNLQPNGRSYTIAREAERILGRRLSTVSLFVILRELEAGGVVSSRWDGPPTPHEPRLRLYWIVGVPFAVEGKP